jgi:pyrrolidone-carboxylate peptidase
MPDLTEFARALAARLELTDVDFDVDAVLDLAGEAAHGVVRPAAPVTTFLVGLAAGRAGATTESLASAMTAAREQIAGVER